MRFIVSVCLALAAVSVKANDVEESAKKCEPGTVIRKDCNTCVCSSKGAMACTLMLCPIKTLRPEQVRENPLLRQRRQISDDRPCAPGSTFKIYCNNCTCGLDGFSAACTRMACSTEIWNPDGSLRHPELVETSAQRPGQVPNNALLRQRREVSGKTTCEPGSRFKVSCNTCTCGLDGLTVACTRMSCPTEMFNEDDSLKHPEQLPKYPLVRLPREVSMAKRCEPGETIMDKGYTCTCRSDGYSYSCLEFGQ